jgi:hypothetical protein
MIIFITKIGIKYSWLVWLPLYIGQIALLITVATEFSKTEGLGFASVIIIMSESIRMTMKAHSYLRTKLLYLTDNNYKNFEFRGVKIQHVTNSRISHDGNNDENKAYKINIKNDDVFSEIKKISYFLFCPTLIYRD